MSTESLLSDWQNPEPGVLTWRDYVIRRNPSNPASPVLALVRRDNPNVLGIGEPLAILKALAERDFAERVEMGEVEVKRS